MGPEVALTAVARIAERWNILGMTAARKYRSAETKSSREQVQPYFNADDPGNDIFEIELHLLAGRIPRLRCRRRLSAIANVTGHCPSEKFSIAAQPWIGQAGGAPWLCPRKRFLSHVKHPDFFGVMIRRERCTFFERYSVPAFGALVFAADWNRVALFSKNLCHGSRLPR